MSIEQMLQGEEIFHVLYCNHVLMEHMILNSDMVLPGADAARFLETLSGYLSAPESMDTEATDKIQPQSNGKTS